MSKTKPETPFTVKSVFKYHNGANPIEMSTNIPPKELKSVMRLNLPVDETLRLLDKMEGKHKTTKFKTLGWFKCKQCNTLFLFYARKRIFCSLSCKAVHYKHIFLSFSHRGRSGWTEQSHASWKEKTSGANNHAWKGGVTYFYRRGLYSRQKIKYVKCPPEYAAMARKDGYVMEYRLNVAKAIGRPLTRMECVHHVNHNAEDCRLVNLMLFANNSDHKRYEHGADIEPVWKHPDFKESDRVVVKYNYKKKNNKK